MTNVPLLSLRISNSLIFDHSVRSIVRKIVEVTETLDRQCIKGISLSVELDTKQLLYYKVRQ